MTSRMTIGDLADALGVPPNAVSNAAHAVGVAMESDFSGLRAWTISSSDAAKVRAKVEQDRSKARTRSRLRVVVAITVVAVLVAGIASRAATRSVTSEAAPPTAAESAAPAVASVIPNLIGLSSDAAAAALFAEGLQAGPTTYEPSDRPAGTVIGQTPSEGNRVEAGSSVALVLAEPRAVVAAPTREPLPEPEGIVTTGVVTKVVDGDTIDVDGVRVRIIGIDTPERGECGYDLATEAMAALVDGRTVTLTSVYGKDDTDRYGRLLRYVDRGTTDAGLSMINEGLAIARYDSRDGYGAHPREERYIAADDATGDVTCS
jgi:endonuclease YncB( thermonuclease family)